MTVEFFHGNLTMIDYTPGSAVTAGTGRIVGGKLRIVNRDIAANALGAEAVPSGTAIWRVPLDTGESFADGDDVPFDVAAQKADITSGQANVGLRCIAAADQGAGDTHVLCLHTDGVQGGMVSKEVTFTEAGDTTYTGSVVLPAGATLVNIIVHATALWDDGTSASMQVGDASDPDGYFTAVDLKATDLLAGESIDFAKVGGVGGAYLAGTATHWTDRYSAAARSITGVVTTGAQNGTAGRTRMTVIYSVPSNVIAAAGA